MGLPSGEIVAGSNEQGVFPYGQNRIELLNHQFDIKLDDSLFSLEIPPGADVLQMDE